ncbi:hypothetical protein OG911_12160 [Streptomyces sp. NBC_00208]|uniref:hypothetical protein n=1 Tax=Streptomyces sp. NBC_00208 TaxID=2975681 RepID=UPI002E2CB402|nr:hypothetical protein [Streptomyces sp. NBC_00208]
MTAVERGAGAQVDLDEVQLHGDEAPPAQGPRLTAEQYESLRRLAFVSIGAWTLGRESKAIKFAANASFAAVQRHVAQFDQRAWNYNSNLNVYLLLLSLTDSRGSLAEDNYGFGKLWGGQAPVLGVRRLAPAGSSVPGSVYRGRIENRIRHRNSPRY